MCKNKEVYIYNAKLWPSKLKTNKKSTIGVRLRYYYSQTVQNQTAIHKPQCTPACGVLNDFLCLFPGSWRWSSAEARFHQSATISTVSSTKLFWLHQSTKRSAPHQFAVITILDESIDCSVILKLLESNRCFLGRSLDRDVSWFKALKVIYSVAQCYAIQCWLGNLPICQVSELQRSRRCPVTFFK